jgi:acetamidase/formamidase
MDRLSKTIHACRHCSSLHPHWDKCIPPALRVAPGEVFTLTSPDASNGALHRNSTADDIASLDFTTMDPLCGPVYVEGAQPGDTLKVEILDLELGDWGWTGLMKNFGLLAEDFPQSYFRGFDLTKGTVDLFGVPFRLQPMMGVLGVAPAEPGPHSSVTPTRAGGNLDVRYLTAGATLYLPVFNEGALLSGGDGHALQGEGEISGTAIEAPLTATLRVDVVKNRPLKAPVIDMSTANYTETEYRNFLGVQPDLFLAAQDACRFAVEELARSLKVEPYEAYSIMGMVGELRIHEIVDKPNWVVGCMLPRSLFGRE